MLASQQRSLIRHMLKRCDDAEKNIFEGESAIYTLQSILLDMLNDSNLRRTYFLVDALDECDIQLRELLETITYEIPQAVTRIKWIVSSRNRPEIEECLGRDGVWKKISLELNSDHISRGVDVYIGSKVDQLARSKRYSHPLKTEVNSQLREKAEGTFLWVHLACERLEKVSLLGTKRELECMPRGLNTLYKRMIKQVMDQDKFEAEMCKNILCSAAVAYRPLHFQEIISFLSLPEGHGCDNQALIDIIERCGSFLTIRQETIYFIHQSAKDYFVSGDGRTILPFNEVNEHSKIIRRSLAIMPHYLRKDMCDLEKRGDIAEIPLIDRNDGPLVPIKYMCHYWVKHLISYNDSGTARDDRILCDDEEIHKFLQKHFLHWIEALALLGQLAEGVLMIKDLEFKIDVGIPQRSTGL